MKQLTELQSLIEHAILQAESVDSLESTMEKAKNAYINQKSAAAAAWDKVYDLLVNVAVELEEDDSFRTSKLGYMLRAETEKLRRAR